MKRLWTLFVALCALASIVCWPDAKAQDVYLDHSRGAVPESMVAWSAWAWSEKAGFRVDMAGESSGWCVEGRITLRRATSAEWVRYGSPKVKALTDDCEGTGNHAYEILLHPLASWSQSLITHEMGHALGCWDHLPSSHDLMHPTAASQNGLTQQDILCATETPFWPLYENPDLCAALLLPGDDVYIPEISEHRARLKFYGFDAMGRHLWTTAHQSANPALQGCPGYTVVGDTATIPDVRVMGLGSFRATLRLSGGLWVLVGAYPR